MKEETWVGPHGTTVVRRNGSAKPPTWALRMIDRVGHRERERRRTTQSFKKIGLRWTRGNGGGRFYPSRDWYPIIAARVEGHSESYQRYLLIHELAHWIAGASAWHGDRFYVALLRIARDEDAVGLFKSEPKAKMARARKALKVAA